jgi:N-acetylmuramoyl-L-alanine amidase
LRAAAVGAANGANGGAGSSRKLVVIDPGHGGESAGARTSVKIGGSHHLEKDLVLSIARRMVPFFEQSPNLSVILTRWDDRDVSLDDRIRIAEQADADLFVSIHLNAQSSAKKTARGFEVYYLDDGARATNRHLESIENDRGVGAATRVASGGGLMAILNDLAGEKVAAFRAESRELGETIDQVFSRSGPFRSRTRGVKAANFRVLMNSEMPAVLAECGFIDHPEDAAMLVGPNGQDRVAALLFNSINHYFARVDPAFQAYLAPVD